MLKDMYWEKIKVDIDKKGRVLTITRIIGVISFSHNIQKRLVVNKEKEVKVNIT